MNALVRREVHSFLREALAMGMLSESLEFYGIPANFLVDGYYGLRNCREFSTG
jgi:hypothetical protein